MTLKEKFDNIISQCIPIDWENKCVEVADEFAIGFADWIRVCKLKGRPYDFENIGELLEIYKEENDL